VCCRQSPALTSSISLVLTRGRLCCILWERSAGGGVTSRLLGPGSCRLAAALLLLLAEEASGGSGLLAAAMLSADCRLVAGLSFMPCICFSTEPAVRQQTRWATMFSSPLLQTCTCQPDCAGITTRGRTSCACCSPCSAPAVTASVELRRRPPLCGLNAAPPPAAGAAEGPSSRSAAMSTRATAAGSRADGDRCMPRGGVGLLLGTPAAAAASESLSRARLD
jgi:hypothetical protein